MDLNVAVFGLVKVFLTSEDHSAQTRELQRCGAINMTLPSSEGCDTKCSHLLHFRIGSAPALVLGLLFRISLLFHFKSNFDQKKKIYAL